MLWFCYFGYNPKNIWIKWKDSSFETPHFYLCLCSAFITTGRTFLCFRSKLPYLTVNFMLLFRKRLLKSAVKSVVFGASSTSFRLQGHTSGQFKVA